jgi:hypothetical protein
MLATLAAALTAAPAAAGDEFSGRYYRGSGDVEYLRLLETARAFFDPNPIHQNLPMLYTPAWNGMVEGPTWGAWWVQNSYGTTYCALPFLDEPYLTFLQNSQDLWFSQMGDGVRKGAFDWVAPDGCLCDAAAPGWIVYRQGDGRTDIHDWGMEFTAAGLLLQSELLLISRDSAAIAHYVPMLERCANFIESRRDPRNNLFLAGPAGNLLAPSYAGWRRPDGTYDKAYLTGLSVTYIAALGRLIEVEKLAGRLYQARDLRERQRSAREGLALLTTDEGYLIRSLDPNGVKHGVFGAKEHGYFEASPNHDAICFRVVDEAQAERIYRKIAAIPELRPHAFILPNYPSYDDMYTAPEGLWGFGTWVNGGHWSTCEARAVMAYYRLGKHEDIRRSMHQLLRFADRFRMDNPLTQQGNEVYQPGEPINLCYDTFGPPAAMMRGLFECVYSAEGVRLIPHVPATITHLEQLSPFRLGRKRVTVEVTGIGPVTSVRVNGAEWRHWDRSSVMLPHDEIPDAAHVEIALGGATLGHRAPAPAEPARGATPPADPRAAQLTRFIEAANAAGYGDTYEVAHARLVLDCIHTIAARDELLAVGDLAKLPEASQAAADKSYRDTVDRLMQGLDAHLRKQAESADPAAQALGKLWG